MSATTTRINAVAKTSIGRVRARNEDAFLIVDIADGAPHVEDGAARFTVGAKGALLAVSDGMGGHKAGNVASVMTLDSLYRSLVRQTSEPEIDARLVRATEAANADVFTAGRRPSLANMGSTVTAVLVEGATAYVAEVGDSRAYVLRNGELHRLTLDQSFAQVAVSAGALKPQDVAESPLRNMLVQAMGQSLELSVALSVLELRKRDCLVLASDGLTSKLTDEEIAREILAVGSLVTACDNLIALANLRGGEDNITVLLAGISEGAPDAAREERFSGTFRVVKAFEPRELRGSAQAPR
jgi:serine/threonine protein phosphatase PrpC